MAASCRLLQSSSYFPLPPSFLFCVRKQASVSKQARCLSTSRRGLKELYWNDKPDPNEEKFDKVLIANRGEIACRVIHTCQRLGIKTVAVHSDVDSLAVHTRMADEAVCIGKAPTSESYLRMDKILEAVQSTGAKAVHPGYGFLSENTTFAAKLKEIGVEFVGPNSEAIHAMGDKIESKRIAKKAEVNMIPGFDGVVQDVEHCVKLAKEIGYPVMIKATAGGGGKGMRIAKSEEEARSLQVEKGGGQPAECITAVPGFQTVCLDPDVLETAYHQYKQEHGQMRASTEETAFKLCTDEAKSSFGDDRMLIEKFVENPRHIEMQVLCDRHGNAIWLNERECSIQRRNQKVIEEAPSTFLDPGMRKAMGDQAVALAKAVGYDSAGTVEFLVDKKKNFYFLEMNTRLQVEHPITEYITGIDIVHQMLRVAKGQKLIHQQSDIPVDGWAIECRVYAEDPFRNFGMPSIGRLSRYIEPAHIQNVRCDSGVEEGSEISIYYDPMICKLVSYGADRQAALETMVTALDSYVIKGVTHNIPLLRDVMTENRFVRGDLTTNYLPEVFPDGFKGKQLTEVEVEQLVALACAVYETSNQKATAFLNQDRLPVTQDSKNSWQLVVETAGKTFPATVTKDHDAYEVKVGDNQYTVTGDLCFTSPLMDLLVNGQRRLLQLVEKGYGSHYKLRLFGTVFSVRVLEDFAAQMAHFMPEKKELDLSTMILAPMPGMLKSVDVNVGDEVGEGQQVCILEAMKMQNSLVSSKVSKVKKVNFKPGDTVNEGDVIAEFE